MRMGVSAVGLWPAENAEMILLMEGRIIGAQHAGVRVIAKVKLAMLFEENLRLISSALLMHINGLLPGQWQMICA